MTATTQDRNTPFKDGELIVVPLAANVRIQAGTMVCASETGFATPGATATTLAYLGMADEAAENSTAVDGTGHVRVRRGKAFKWANDPADPVTQANVGRVCFIVDNQTVAASHGDNTRSQAGKVLAVESDGVWVI